MPRPFRHLTPRYVRDRIAVMIEYRRNPDHPWLTAEAVSLLARLIKPTDRGVEFGSGRSTAWFAARLGHLTSIEDNPDWSEKVRSMLASRGLSEVDYRAHADPDAYVRQATTFADASVDFCLIDGIERDRCAEEMLPKIRPGGIFVIDNINWFMPNNHTKSPASRRSEYASPIWERVGQELSAWRHIWTSNGVTDTAIWFKP